MGLFGRKKASLKVSNDRELISENEKTVDALILLAESNETLTKQLRDIKEKIKYLIPSEDSKIYDFDKKIQNLIQDVRIALVKTDGEPGKKIDNALLQLDLAIVDRNAKL